MDRKIYGQNKTLKAQNDTYYVALSMKVEKTQRKYFKKEIKDQLAGALGAVSLASVCDISVYSHGKTAEKHGSFQVWDYLILIQIKEKEEAEKIMPYLKKIRLPIMPVTIRMELLVTTPNSTYSVPGEGAAKRYFKPFYAVEYVDVNKDYLEEFRRIMITNNGPAMKYIMEHAKWCFNFYALETVHVFYHNPDYPTWNQVHIIGLYPESMLKYKKDFSKGLEVANHISFEENFLKLKKIRTMLYKSVGKKL